ncbi:protein HEXIM1-like [Mantella aurantiaca]
MAEVAIQEPCESLAGGETLLGSRQEESGWPPEEGRGQRNPSPLSGPEEQWKELGRKRHRRRPSKKKRPWKPYNKLTWEEKKRLEEREAQRASRVRAEMFAKGQPVAPYNTTQFLMDDHDLEEPDLCPPPPKRGPAVTAPPPLHINSCDLIRCQSGSCAAILAHSVIGCLAAFSRFTPLPLSEGDIPGGRWRRTGHSCLDENDGM